MMETVIVPTPGTLNCAMDNDLQVVHGHACDCNWLLILQATAAEHQHVASESRHCGKYTLKISTQDGESPGL